MKLLRWFFGLFSSNNKNSSNFQSRYPSDIIREELGDEDLAQLDLEKARLKAINACDGCEEQVFVLKKDGKEVDYAPNINQLATRNGLNKVTLYRYWNDMQAGNKRPKSKFYKKRWEVINYK